MTARQKQLINDNVETGTNTCTLAVDAACELMGAHVLYTSSAVAGNRQMRMLIKDSVGNVLIDAHAGAVMAASLSREFLFVPGTYRETSFIDTALQVPFCSGFVCPEGGSITFVDFTDVDGVDDAITARIQTERLV